MLISEFLHKKALDEDNKEMTKLASEFEFTEDDLDLDQEKLAGLLGSLGSAALAGGKELMKSKVLKNAAIGAGVGAVAGAANAPEGQGIKGAVKGGLIGAAVGGIGTAGKNVYNNMKPAMGPGMSLGGAIKREGSLVAGTAKDANKTFGLTRKGVNVSELNAGNYSAPIGPTPVPTANDFKPKPKPKPEPPVDPTKIKAQQEKAANPFKAGQDAQRKQWNGQSGFAS